MAGAQSVDGCGGAEGHGECEAGRGGAEIVAVVEEISRMHC